MILLEFLFIFKHRVHVGEKEIGERETKWPAMRSKKTVDPQLHQGLIPLAYV